MEQWRKAWNYVWHGKGVIPLLLQIFILFLIIRYLFYPLLGAALGTPLPIVSVVSGSMEHDGSFDDWWGTVCCVDSQCSESFTQEEFYARYDLSKEIFEDFPFRNGLNKGDLIVLRSADETKIGDVLVFSGARGEPIIHRIVDSDGTLMQTKGDHNCGLLPIEEMIVPDQRLGKAWFRVPFLGYVKIWAVGLVNSVRPG